MNHDEDNRGDQRGDQQGGRHDNPHDAMLWELAGEHRASDEDPADPWRPDDEMLRAYRAGELDEATGRRLELALARDRALRRRLLALAGVELEQPPAHLRQRVLDRVVAGSTESLPGASTRSPVRMLPFPLRRLRPLLAAAALLLAVGMGLVWWLEPGSDPARPAVTLAELGSTEFDIRFELGGLVREGSSGDAESVLATRPVDPDQRIRIVIEPRDAAVAGVEFALYRSVARGRWSRLGPGDGIELESGRGSAAFNATAARLAGARSGTHPLLVAVAAKGQLPAVLAVGPDDDPATVLARRSGGLARRHELRLDGETNDGNGR